METELADAATPPHKSRKRRIPHVDLVDNPRSDVTASDHVHDAEASKEFASLLNLLRMSKKGSATNIFKRTWSHLKVQPVDPPDFVSMGLFSEVEAESYFNTFFQGCNQYVPVFDPRCDSLHGIRSRSSLLFSTICAVGCRVLNGTDSHEWHLLNFHIKRALNSVIGTPESATLETVQALLVRACYVSERSLFVTLATRLAVDLGLPEAYEQLSTRFVSRIRGSGSETRMDATAEDDSLLLMRKARTWLHLLVLGHMLHVDASDLLTFKFHGDVRRCRVLLDGRFSTDLDLHLFSQVELNVLRASTYASLSNSPGLSDDEIMDIVRDAKIDIDLWFNDWMSIFERSQSQKRQLSVNIRIQRCWADTMVLCRAVRVSGVENVDAMSETQRSILLMAKDALTEHLNIVIEEPRGYLHNLRFAMDFVWAKCAFCLLLLFKLSMLLDEDDEQTSRDLIERGKTLLAELRSAGGTADGGRSGTSRLYIQLLQTGIEKYGRTVLNENVMGQTDVLMTGANTPRRRTGVAVGSGGHNELESFVPEQFVFEWDFPGLTLFSSRTTEAGWLDDFLRSALVGEDFYGLGWNSADDV
ncbi:uncharacterized protein DNG_00154 [Cephalotrichum gorgonifer]|uniref:Uncharacterized protein n=1 Tax=Cephalotrichum gorgonifer TaxID=2041049 RepID=A0AAE8SQH9_9PEZI|nr:uncharacterized protein DNG_00154 [Cephalotrichum gorgonifer]